MSSSLEVKMATKKEEIVEALRLRYKVFIEETNNIQCFNNLKMETDLYDAYCDHLIVTNSESGKVVGTYRLLPGDRVKNHIGFYSETEFDLSQFPVDKGQILELGRSCIAAEYRNGKVIHMLWDGIASYIAKHGYHFLIGCASLTVQNQAELNEIYSLLKHYNIITDRFGVQPLQSHQINGLKEIEVCATEKEMYRRLPPLMKGYCLLGAEFGGEPVYDPIFNTTDFLIVLETSKIERRYRRHFIDRNGGKNHCTN